MSNLSDEYVVDASVPDFVRIDYSSKRSTAAGPHELEAAFWFERSNVEWVVRALEAFLTVYALPEQRSTCGRDALRVYESGPEQAPYINLENERAAGAPHEGFYWFAMSKPLALELAKELAALA